MSRLTFIRNELDESSAMFKTFNNPRQARAAVLRCFCDPLPEPCLRLQDLTAAEWRQMLRWLDISGLALYFWARLDELNLRSMLPPAVAERLERNLLDNTQRTRNMISECCSIQTAFQESHVSYAVLKGFSLWPASVSKLELRSQLDLDFLVARKSADTARAILEEKGYRLHAVSGRSWEFKTAEPRARSLADLYKPLPYRCVELHLEEDVTGKGPLPYRTSTLEFQGIKMPVLAPVDLFLGQAMHLFKHICSEFSRTAHLLEFRRHVLARYDDGGFWREVEQAALDRRPAQFAVGVSTLLVTRAMGEFAPAGLTRWTVDGLPGFAHLWVDRYGYGAVFGDFPGTKYYLLLQRELEKGGTPARRSVRRALLPLKLPPPIAPTPIDESLAARLRRHWAQLRFILFRLRFHIAEGLRFGAESIRWRYALARRGNEAGEPADTQTPNYLISRAIPPAQQRNDNSLTRI